MLSKPNKKMDYIKFDVGHHLYTTHKSTLLRFQDSILSKYVAPPFDTRATEHDYINIDRDGRHFGHILNYMRDGMLPVQHWSDRDLAELRTEADFYCLTELVDLCEQQIDLRLAENSINTDYYKIPHERKMEVIFGLGTLKDILNAAVKQTLVISYNSMLKYHVSSWFEELVELCDYDKYELFCFSSKNEDTSNEKGLHDFFISLYDPIYRRIALTIQAPPLDKFLNKRNHYKCKIYKYWFKIQKGSLRDGFVN